MYAVPNKVQGGRFGWRCLLIAALIALLAPALVSAAPPAQDAGCAEEYTVQADDWLSKLAEKYLGDAMDYPMIADATNKAFEADSRFAQIGDHDFIEVGWLLCIPPAPAGESAPAATQPEPEAVRIQFDAGGTTANISDKVSAGNIDRYVLEAAEGQLMWVSLLTDGTMGDNGPETYLSIWGKDGTVLISDHAGLLIGTVPCLSPRTIISTSSPPPQTKWNIHWVSAFQPPPRPTPAWLKPRSSTSSRLCLRVRPRKATAGQAATIYCAMMPGAATSATT